MRVIALKKCVMIVIREREKYFIHWKEKLVRFMTVSEIISVCKIVVNVGSASVYDDVKWVIFIITTRIYIKMRINRIWMLIFVKDCI